MRLAFLLLLAAAVTLQPQTQTASSPKGTQPRIVWKVDPEYTKEAIEAKLQGLVLLATDIKVDQSGR
jgi:hypothetical protein